MGGREGGVQTKEHCCCLTGVLGRVDTRLEEEGGGRGWRRTDGARV